MALMTIWTEVATKKDLADLQAEIFKAMRGQLLAFITVVAIFNALTVGLLTRV